MSPVCVVDASQPAEYAMRCAPIPFISMPLTGAVPKTNELFGLNSPATDTAGRALSVTYEPLGPKLMSCGAVRRPNQRFSRCDGPARSFQARNAAPNLMVWAGEATTLM